MNPESKEVLHRFKRNKLACLGVILVIVLAALSLLAPVIAPYEYEEQDLILGAAPPSAEHWLGTDVLGRDLFTRLLYGGRISLMVGICATAVSLVIGVTYGSISGYFGGRADIIMMRIVDILYALPFTIFVIILTVVFGRNIILLFAVMGVFLVFFLRRALATTTQFAAAMAALALLAAAVGLDFVEGIEGGHRWIEEGLNASAYKVRHYSKAIEETMEMFAMTLFLAVFVLQVAAAAPSITVRFEQESE